MDSPDQGAFGIPLTTGEVDAGQVTLAVAAIGVSYSGGLTSSGNAVAGTSTQGPVENLCVPVLSLIGEKDLQVPYDLNNPEIEAALNRGGNPDTTVVTLPGLNHRF